MHVEQFSDDNNMVQYYSAYFLYLTEEDALIFLTLTLNLTKKLIFGNFHFTYLTLSHLKLNKFFCLLKHIDMQLICKYFVHMSLQ
jgi:hypothetical protein